MTDEQKAKLLKPLMHSRLGKIDYASKEKYQAYTNLFQYFGLVFPDGGREEIRDWL